MLFAEASHEACQDISVAGKGAGIDGERSGLWAEFARIIHELRPAIVFVENVPPIVKRGLDRVLADLAEVGMDATWDCFRASDVGAPHKRERFFLLAYTDGERVREFVADSDGPRLEGEDERQPKQSGTSVCRDERRQGADMADTDGRRRESVGLAQPGDFEGSRGRVADGRGDVGSVHRFPPGPDEISGWDGPRPAVRRRDAGIPRGLDRGWRTQNRVSDRLRLLGNACCPQQAALALEVLTARVLAESAHGGAA
jgi:site-specific DNA-cytosine methylase